MTLLYLHATAGLKAKERQMRSLVRLAEQREAAAKAEIGKLLESRSGMFDRPEGSSPPAAEVDSQAQNAGTHEFEHRVETVKTKFNKLRSICISSEQGLKSLLERCMIALEEVHPDQLRASHLKGLSEAKPYKARSGPARRPSSLVQTPDRRRTTPRSQSPGVPLTPDGKPSSPPTGADGLMGETIHEGHGVEGDEVAAAVAGNTLEDEHFFPELPDLLHSAFERLKKIMIIVSEEQGGVDGEC